MPLKVAYIGSTKNSWNTETHLAREMRSMGCEVHEFQEPDNRAAGEPFLYQFEQWCFANKPDLVMYTRTWGLPDSATLMWRRLEQRNIVTCSYHLDLYVGLKRERDISQGSFWRTQYVFTPDGDPRSARVFYKARVNHHFMSPAVVSDECGPGNWNDKFDVDVAFVGSESYHHEWQWRPMMIAYLRNRFGDRFRRFNKDTPSGVVRDQDLNDLVTTARVVVGDSLHLPGHQSYWSDRYFETIGRGGLLVGPWIEGLDDYLTPDLHYFAYAHPDDVMNAQESLDAMGNLVQWVLDHPQEAEATRLAGTAHVQANHTYRHRLAEAFEIMGLAKAADLLAVQVQPDQPPEKATIAKLELGSGFNPTPGFTTLDANPACNPDIVSPAWPIDLPDHSVSEIRAVDVLEHLSFRDTAAVLADWHRVLVKGGSIFIQVPDAELIMQWFVNEPERLAVRVGDGLPHTALAGATWRLLGGHNDGVYVKDGQDWRWNAHYALFSQQSLTDALEEAGFAVVSMQVNAHPNILCVAVAA